MTAHIATWKTQEVQHLTSLLAGSKVVGIIDIKGIPAKQMQQMRKKLKDVARIHSSKNSLIKIALQEAGKKVNGLDQLADAVKGQSAIIITDMNPFKLYTCIKETRTMSPAKGGEIATSDIIVKAGETPFKPGPIVGELQKVGIPAAIQEGKVVIKNDKVIVPAGKKIPKDIASMLTRLEIYPIEIGINVYAVYENGQIYKPDILDINLDRVLSDIRQASLQAFNLAMESAWVSKDTVRPLVEKAYRNALALAFERGIVTKDTVSKLLLKGYQSMSILASRLSKEALDEELQKNVT
ncbi:MAG: 50S ribosomal protein L10 [Candidatus Thermoplasmatota archaeon]